MEKEPIVATQHLIDQLRNAAGETCVSIILPQHALSHERQMDPIVVKKAIGRVSEELSHSYNKRDAAALMQSLTILQEQIDYSHSSQGIGLFVSASVQSLFHFHFPVTEKIMVGGSFEVRDLLYEMSYALPYQVLLLTNTHAHIFNGQLQRLEEVKDTIFPVAYSEEYTYNPSGPGASSIGSASTRSFEQDKSKIQSIRHEQFFRKVDKLLDTYITKDSMIIVASEARELASFCDVSDHMKQVYLLHGNYTYSGHNDLEARVWKRVKEIEDDKKQRLVKEYEEKTGTGMAEEGLQSVWRATQEGRAHKLLVEKDYRCAGFADESDPAKLHLRYADNPNAIVLTDAVEALISAVIDKNGSVHFVENGALQQHQHIALITRY